MRKPLITGNWKMNTSGTEGVALARRVANQVADIDSVEVVVCPPFVSLASVANALQDSNVLTGAQDVSEFDYGAHTGDIAVGMITDFADYVIVGHSERRGLLGETDEVVAAKVAGVIDGGITPILCVGEDESTREDGRAEQFVRDEVITCLAGYGTGDPLVIAYEPIWAIGTGLAASLPQIEYMVESIREALADTFDQPTAALTRILYGGSVNRSNIGEYAASDSIDGALVGGASLDADEFATIVKVQAATASQA